MNNNKVGVQFSWTFTSLSKLKINTHHCNHYWIKFQHLLKYAVTTYFQPFYKSGQRIAHTVMCWSLVYESSILTALFHSKWLFKISVLICQPLTFTCLYNFDGSFITKKSKFQLLHNMHNSLWSCVWQRNINTNTYSYIHFVYKVVLIYILCNAL